MKTSADYNPKERFSFWVSSKDNYVSLHPEKGYEKIACSDYKKMWDWIYELVDLGFRVQ